MTHKSIAQDSTWTGDDIQHSGWQPRITQNLHHFERKERRIAGRFEYDGIARQQRRKSLPGRNSQGKIPGSDNTNDAEGLSKSMARLISNPELRARMAQRSRDVIGTWTFARGVEGVKAALAYVSRGSTK